MDEGVGERQQAAAGGDVQRGVVGADRVHLVRDDPGRDLVADEEPLDVGAVRELVQPRGVAVDAQPNSRIERLAVAQVVAVGEDDPLRDAGRVGAEPPEPLRRDHRVEKRPGLGEVIGAHVLLDAGVGDRPPEDAGMDLRGAPAPLLASRRSR